MADPSVIRSTATVACSCGADHRFVNTHRGEWLRTDCNGCGQVVEFFAPRAIVNVTSPTHDALQREWTVGESA